jgi:hypothetical protein
VHLPAILASIAHCREALLGAAEVIAYTTAAFAHSPNQFEELDVALSPLSSSGSTY